MKRTVKIFAISCVALFSGQMAFAQKYGATPEDSVECIKNISFYQEYWKQQNYKDCYGPWKKVIQLCPGTSKNLYIRGTTILRHMISIDPANKNLYVQELLNMFDIRTKYFGEGAENKARKAMEMRTYLPDSIEAGYKLFVDAVEEGGNELDAVMVYSYFLATLDYVQKRNGDASLVIENSDKAITLLENIQKKEPKNENIKSYIANIELGFSPYASCDKLVAIFTPKYKESPNDIALLKKITSLLESKKCTNEDLFFKATESLHKLEPTPKSTYMMGRMCAEKDKNGEAINYFKEAFELFTEPKDKYNAAIMLANAAGPAGQYSLGRTYAYKAAELMPNEGQPYLVIASLYAQSAGSCGSGPVYGRVAYLAAYDKCVKAKAVDPGVADQANQMMGRYAASWPDKAEAFMEGLLDGQSYTLPCWIGETVTIRTKK